MLSSVSETPDLSLPSISSKALLATQLLSVFFCAAQAKSCSVVGFLPEICKSSPGFLKNPISVFTDGKVTV